MSWYYLREEGPSGPHENLKMADLGRVGALTSTSLVWRHGLEKWTTIADLGGVASYLQHDFIEIEGAAEELTPPQIDAVECAVSGALGARDSMLEYGETYVLPEHKDQFTRELYENVEKPSENLDLIADGSVITCLQQTWHIIKREWLLFLGLILLFYLPLGAFTFYLEYFVYEEGSLQPSLVTLLLDLTIGSLGASGIYSIAASHWNVRVRSFGGIIRSAFTNWFRLIQVRLFVWAAAFVGALIFVIPGLIILFMLMFAEAMIYSADRETGMNALSSSWNLVKSRIWKALLFGLTWIGIIVGPLIFFWVIYFNVEFQSWTVEGALYLVEAIAISVGLIFTYCAMEHLEN